VADLTPEERRRIIRGAANGVWVVIGRCSEVANDGNTGADSRKELDAIRENLKDYADKLEVLAHTEGCRTR
jgi:hypothetical protein